MSPSCAALASALGPLKLFRLFGCVSPNTSSARSCIMHRGCVAISVIPNRLHPRSVAPRPCFGISCPYLAGGRGPARYAGRQSGVASVSTCVYAALQGSDPLDTSRSPFSHYLGDISHSASVGIAPRCCIRAFFRQSRLQAGWLMNKIASKRCSVCRAGALWGPGRRLSVQHFSAVELLGDS